MSNNYFCHESSIIDPGAQIGEGTRIWHFSHIMGTARIGKNCVIGQNVFIGNNVTIADGVKVQNNVSVYEGVIVEKNVFIGPSVVFTNVINPRSFIERKSEFKESLIKEGSSIGANATILCGITIGAYAMIGAGATVTDDVKDFAIVKGIPARWSGWVCQCGVKLELNNDASTVCSACGTKYNLNKQNIEIA